MTQGVFEPEMIAAMVSARRMGKTGEVASLASSLASDDATYITGQVIGVNGGMI